MAIGSPPQNFSSFDYVLIGTGLAPLIAARELMDLGKSVGILNPLRDFFLENGELPVDLKGGELSRNLDQVADLLSPYYPGNVERLNLSSLRKKVEAPEYRDPLAPAVRLREKVIAASSPRDRDRLEAHYVARMGNEGDARHLQWIEGLMVTRRFPGFSKKAGSADGVQGLWERSVVEMDVQRYCSGILDFLLERIEPSGIQYSVEDVQVHGSILKFRAAKTGSGMQSWEVREHVLIFCSPAMMPLIRELARDCDRSDSTGLGSYEVIQWEKWNVSSRDAVDPGLIGVYGDLWIWADYQGDEGLVGPIDLAAVLRPVSKGGVASEGTFQDLSLLFHEFLGWDRFSVRGVQVYHQLVFHQTPASILKLRNSERMVRLVTGVDGPPWQIVSQAKAAVQSAMEIPASAPLVGDGRRGST
jgi:hypothetical protein